MGRRTEHGEKDVGEQEARSLGRAVGDRRGFGQDGLGSEEDKVQGGQKSGGDKQFLRGTHYCVETYRGGTFGRTLWCKED